MLKPNPCKLKKAELYPLSQTLSSIEYKTEQCSYHSSKFKIDKLYRSIILNNHI